MKELKFAIDSYNFKNIIENKVFYIDKTLFIKELIEDKTGIFLFPRPRRFGKSLNFSMLKYFFDMKEDSKDLFKGLKVNKCSESLKHMNQYPVVSINFKGMDELNWEEAKKEIVDRISFLYKEHGKNLYDILEKDELKFYREIEKKNVEDLHIKKSLLNLTQYLEKRYNKKVVLLVDEYDAVITKMFLRTEEEFIKCMNLFRGMYENAFKGNDSLYKGLLTGIMRVAKEGMFSGLNNVDVYGVNLKRYSKHFGFLEEEIKPIIEEQELNFEDAKNWYNGYNFSENVVYNPWSISNYLKQRELAPYWKNKSGDDLLKKFIKKGGPEVKYSLEEMLLGNSLELEAENDINLRDLDEKDIYGLLLQSGYLTYEKIDEVIKYKLPNKEVKKIIDDLLKIINKKLVNNLSNLEQLIDNRDWDSLKEELEDNLLEALSFYDNVEYREDFYHSLFLGTFITFSKWKVKSNREEGLGRPDLILENKDNGEKVVIEIKAGKKEIFTLERLIEKAEDQIKRKKYGKNSQKIAMAFIGKEFAMKAFK